MSHRNGHRPDWHAGAWSEPKRPRSDSCGPASASYTASEFNQIGGHAYERFERRGGFGEQYGGEPPPRPRGAAEARHREELRDARWSAAEPQLHSHAEHNRWQEPRDAHRWGRPQRDVWPHVPPLGQGPADLRARLPRPPPPEHHMPLPEHRQHDHHRYERQQQQQQRQHCAKRPRDAEPQLTGWGANSLAADAAAAVARSTPAVGSDDGWANRRAHYDRQAHADADRGHALRRRAAGPLIAYKKLANGLKRAQVARCSRAALLADIGCGRGGDLAKWWDARIERVVATDLSPAELDEARRRERELAAERRRGGRFSGRVEWHEANAAEAGLADRLLRWSGGRRYDAVSCQFALQFFFGSAASASAMLAAVSSCLREGGRLFGVAPDGDALVRLCEREGRGGCFEQAEPFGLRVRLLPCADDQPVPAPAAPLAEAPAALDGEAAAGAPSPATDLELPPFRADACGPAGAPDAGAPPGAFGRLVTFALDDTVTAGSDESACTEYVLFPAQLHSLARAAGLEAIAEECGPMLEQASRCGLPQLPEAQRRVASLYFCFAFRKAPAGPQSPAAPAELAR